MRFGGFCHFWFQMRQSLRIFLLLLSLGIFLLVAQNWLQHYFSPASRYPWAKPLDSIVQELNRLERFFSKVSLLCNDAKKFKKNSVVVPVCLEDRENTLQKSNLTIVSLESHNFKLEVALSKWKQVSQVMVLSSSKEVTALQNISNIVIQKCSPADWVSDSHPAIWLGELETIITNANDKTIDILILGNLNKIYLLPAIVDSLLKLKLLNDIKQFHIIITLVADKKFLYDWFSILSALKLKGHFVLFHPVDFQNCKERIIKGLSCQISTSWLKESEDALNLLDMQGSDSEQAATLLRHLTFLTVKCPQIIYSSTDQVAIQEENEETKSFLQPSKWPLCMQGFSLPCTTYSAMFGSKEIYEKVLLHFGCDVYIFDPTINGSSVEYSPFNRTNKMNKFPWGFSQKNNILASTNGGNNTWIFRKPSEIIAELQHNDTMIDLIRLHLHGGEWDALQELIDSNMLQNFRQIVATVHVWYGEEYFSLVRFYVLLQQMEKLGFQLYYSEPLLDVYFAKEKYLKSDFSASHCCFMVGWINQDRQDIVT